jgi:ribonuclease HI
MTNDQTNWKRMRFKENKVWLATDQSEKPVVKNGKVLIKYQLDQDYEYWVHQNKVTSIESSQPETEVPPKKKSAKKPPKTKSAPETKAFDATAYDGAVCIYTDGASCGNPGPSGIGVFLQYGSRQKEISRNIGIATNNIAELEAIRTGLLEIKNADLPVRVFTDSSYAYGVLTLGWKAKKNTQLVRSIRKTIAKFKDLKIIKVKGHAGIEGNEKADLLATSAAKE